jgi:hypothetical protein
MIPDCPDGMSREARLTTLGDPAVEAGASGRRRHAVVSATQDSAHHDLPPLQLRCDVYIAPVHSLDISTVIEKLSVNASEQVHVTAKDEFDNTFSWLEVSRLSWCLPLLPSALVYVYAQGLEFVWSASNAAILRLSMLSDVANIDVSHARRSVEQAGGYSDSVVIHGMLTGALNSDIRAFHVLVRISSSLACVCRRRQSERPSRGRRLLFCASNFQADESR